MSNNVYNINYFLLNGQVFHLRSLRSQKNIELNVNLTDIGCTGVQLGTMNAWRNHNVGPNKVKFESFHCNGKFLKILSNGQVTTGGDDSLCVFRWANIPPNNMVGMGYITLESDVKRGWFLGFNSDGTVRPANSTLPTQIEAWFFPMMGLPQQFVVQPVDNYSNAVKNRYIQIKSYHGDKYVQITPNYPNHVDGAGDLGTPTATWKVLKVVKRVLAIGGHSKFIGAKKKFVNVLENGEKVKFQNMYYKNRFLRMGSNGEVTSGTGDSWCEFQMVGDSGGMYCSFHSLKNPSWRLGAKENGDMANGKDMIKPGHTGYVPAGYREREDNAKFRIVLADTHNMTTDIQTMESNTATFENEKFYYLKSMVTNKNLRCSQYSGGTMTQPLAVCAALDALGGLTPDAVWRIYITAETNVVLQNFQYPQIHLCVRPDFFGTRGEPLSEISTLTWEHHGNHVYSFFSWQTAGLYLGVNTNGLMMKAGEAIQGSLNTKFTLINTNPTVDADNDGELGNQGLAGKSIDYAYIYKSGCKGQSVKSFVDSEIPLNGIAVHMKNMLSNGYVKCNSAGMVFGNGDIMKKSSIWICRMNTNYIYFENYKYKERYLVIRRNGIVETGDKKGNDDDFVPRKNGDGSFTFSLKKSSMKLGFMSSGAPRKAQQVSSGTMSRFKVTYAC